MTTLKEVFHIRKILSISIGCLVVNIALELKIIINDTSTLFVWKIPQCLFFIAFYLTIQRITISQKNNYALMLIVLATLLILLRVFGNILATQQDLLIFL